MKDKSQRFKIALNEVNEALKLKDYESAIRYQSIAVGLYPNHRNYSDRAELYEAAGFLEAAIHDYKIALDYYRCEHIEKKLENLHSKIQRSRLVPV